MGKKSRFLCAVLVVCGVLSALPVLSYWHWIWADLARIETPKTLQTLDYHPVEIVVSFQGGALTNTFEAWLNGHNITDLFKPIPGGAHAYVTPEDGLNCHIIGKNSSWSKLNLLVTNIDGSGNKKDLDLCGFQVEYYPVKTVRDDKGVWFINGGSLGDVMESMGYAVATDRLWQMETYRRSARGTLAEVLGSSQLSTDILMRTFGYSDQELFDGFDALNREEQIIVESYVEGINKRIDDINLNPSLKPFEFIAVNCPLNYWTEEDVLAWMALLLRQFDCEAFKTGQLENAALLQQLLTKYGPAGMAMFNDLRWVNDPEALTYIPSAAPKAMMMAAPGIAASEVEAPAPVISADFEAAAEDITGRMNTAMDNLKKINAFVKMGSYAWVVSGNKTADHKPIIYSGPQMGFTVPSITIEGSIRGGGLNISGMTVPGIPGIIIGRTPHHAWSMQVGHAHTVDYYLESAGNLLPPRVETIKVKGQADVLLPVYRSNRGPIINQSPLISWKYAHWGYEFQSIGAILTLARAKSMDEFGKGIEGVAVSQHFCYADKDGNIAYWMSGRDPVRPSGEWRLPQGAAGAPLEWDAAVLIPRSTDRNIARGYYCGWNNKSSASYADSYNNPSSYFFGPFHRAHVIDDYLSKTDDLTYDEVRDLALNIATTDSFGGGGIPWDFVADDFSNAVINSYGGATLEQQTARQAALDLLAAWDGHFVKGGPTEWAQGTDRSDAWILQDAWIREVIRLTFADELSVNSLGANRLFNVLLHGLAGSSSGIVNTYDWFKNLSDANAPQTPQTIIVKALDNVLASLGNQPWGIGKRGVIEYKHDILGLVNPSLLVVHTMPFSSRSTYAHCVEFGHGGPIRIESMFPLGESGYIPYNFNGTNYDPNFFSMTPVFDPFEPRPFPLFN
jgi:penicillin G amidase